MLIDALRHFSIELKQGIAVALNNVVVARSKWESQPLVPNDKITIIQASQGG